MNRKRRRLKGIKVHEISLVDRGAVPASDFVILSKRDAGILDNLADAIRANDRKRRDAELMNAIGDSIRKREQTRKACSTIAASPIARQQFSRALDRLNAQLADTVHGIAKSHVSTGRRFEAAERRLAALRGSDERN